MAVLTAIAFYVFSAVLIASALMVVAARNPVHSVLFLILAFFNAAALFVILGAEFLAMILVIVYVGARFGLDGDGLRRADRLAQLAGDAAFLAIGIAAQRMFAAKAR